MAGTGDFSAYLQRMVHLDDIEKMTKDLDEQLQGSRRMMSEIKEKFDAIPGQSLQRPLEPETQEDLYKFLDAEVPRLVLPGMESVTADVDFESIIASMKAYAEDLKKRITPIQEQPSELIPKLESLDLSQYATSLDQLNKKLANLKLTKSEEMKDKNQELEEKLTQLCQDVNTFTQVVQTKTKLSESNQSWGEPSQESTALVYDSIVNKLLSGINEVTFLLQNKD